MDRLENFEGLTIQELQTLLRARGLSTSHRVKADLLDRLRRNPIRSTAGNEDQRLTNNDSVILLHSDGSGNEDEVFISNNANDEAALDNTNDEENNNNRDNDDSDNFNDDNGEDNNESDDEMTTHTPFKDVEDALEKYHGLPHENLSKWIDTFDKIAETCKWSVIHKYLYTRKLMAGAARKSIEADPTLLTYDLVVAHLKEEFKEEDNFLAIHAKLSSKKKSSKESHLEFFFDMQKIGTNKMDDASMIRYIVDGLPGDVDKKLTLYQSKTTPELKGKLKIYETLVTDKEHDSRDKGQKKVHPKANKSNNDGKTTKIRCYNCGETSHQAEACPHKGKGKKCYNCDQFGHISKDCRVTKKKSPSVANNTLVMCLAEPTNTMDLQISINNTIIIALFDTGSPYTVMKRSTYLSIPRLGRWVNQKMSMKGLSAEQSYTLGYKWVTIIVNNESYDLQCHVVADELLPMAMILGRDYVRQTHVTIIGGVPTITKLMPDTTAPAELPENNIMTIQMGDEDKNTIDTLPCIQEIEDPVMRAEVAELVRNYKPRIGGKSCVEMEIIVTDNIPVYQNPRRLSPVERNVANEMVERFLKDGIIRPSKSTYASPILLRKKKNGTYRFCIDYRKINDKIVKERYPLPLMEDIIEDLNEDLVFTSLDLIDGFYHVNMAENSIKYTSFITPDGQWEFVYCPQGMCNSPANFQRFINQTMHEAKSKNLLKTYLDDLLLSAKTEAENLDKLRQVLTIAAEAGLKINFNKCKFLQRRIEFLGYVIENHNIHPSDAKMSAIQNFPQPTTLKAIQSFLGLTGYFRKFIEKYAIIAKPLSDLLRKDNQFHFGKKQEASFKTLKDNLCADPVLKIYNPKYETELHTDASALGYGGCLLQKQNDDGQFHPVYFLSFKTTPSESKLHSYELEVYAIIKCLERLRCYVLGIHFVIYTDCQAFQQTMSRKNATAKIARWALALEEYDLEVRHRPATAMKHVDALSRNFVLVIDDGLLAQVKLAQQQDDACNLVRQLLEKGPHKEYIIQGGVIYRHRDGNYQMKVPRAMVHSILLKLHGDAHLSRRRMDILARQEYDITDLGKQIDKFIINCVPCILATKKKGKKDGWLASVGPIPSTKKNYNHCFVVIDAFTKFVWIYPVKSTQAEEAITKLQSQQTIFGNPERIIADKYSSFKSNAFNEYCKQQNIHLHLITAGVPRGNGQVERIMGIIVPILTKMAIDNPAKWFNFTSRVQRSINSSISRATNKTPFEIMFGIKMRNPEDAEITKVIEEEILNNFDDHRQKLRQQARDQILAIQTENQRAFNKKRKEPHLYTLGDMVAIERTQNEAGLKVRPKMLGPYEVTRVLRNHRYEVRKIGSHEGPMSTSSSADKMKSWTNATQFSDE